MSNRHILIAFLSVSIALVCYQARADITVTQIDYQGWNPAVRISNGDVELVCVPQIGRIMRYARVGGNNMLWNNPQMLGKIANLTDAAMVWPNFGGDKLWPAPQSAWNWPPDPVLDSSPQKLKILPDHHLLMIGNDSQKTGIRFEREIILDPKGTTVHIINSMINTSKAAVKWGIWEIFQTNNPARVFLPLNLSGHFTEGYAILSKPPFPAADEYGGSLLLSRGKKNSYKFGTDAPVNTLRALIHGEMITISAPYYRSGNYPDGGCDAEVWSNPDPLDYMEMEMMAPIHILKPGEQVKFETTWKITPPQSP